MTKPPSLHFDWRRHWRLLLVVVLGALALAGLFGKADSISIDQHYAYTSTLLRFSKADAELNAVVVANRYGLQRDFDSVTAGMHRVRELAAALSEVPEFLSPAHRAEMASRVEELAALSARKAEAVDRFKREDAILQNSLSYFPIVTDGLIVEGVLPLQLSRRAGIFGRSVMNYALTGDPSTAERVRDELRALEAEAERLPEQAAQRLRNQLAHARLILQHKPILDGVTQEILDLPTGSRADALSLAYASHYNRALHEAHVYRVLLFVVAVGLAGYLILMIVRQRQTALELAAANSRLKDRVDALDRAQDELKRYATVFTNASEGMVITDERAVILAVNPAFTEITGYALQDIAGKTPAVLQSGRQDKAYYREMWAALNGPGQWQGEIWNRRRSGEVYPEWLSIAAVRDAAGRTTHYIGIFSDVTERKQAEERIQHLANHDALTGLPNRLLLQDRLEQALRQAKRNGRNVAVLFFDLDRFKVINDTLGHDVGDGLLRIVTQRCRGVVRETDTLARHGGDEFVVVLPDLEHAQDAGAVARKLLAAVTEPCELDGHQLTVTCSIGIAVYPADGDSGSILLRNADAAMCRAKDDGRNAYQFYTSDMNTASLGELLLEQQLRGALKRDEFRLHYQPKVDARSGRLMGCEALLRWQHPEHGLLAPGRFVPVAEENGLILPIGRWVIEEACRQQRAWLDAGLEPVPVAVNLSAQQFVQGDIVATVREALERSQLPAELLELELTETILMRDAARTLDILAGFSRLGVSLAIDDFGTGYSSLAYLRQFNVDTLKIDRSFVQGIESGTDDAKIATAIIALAHSLGLRVTAEGVENAAQHRILADRHCDYLQGYLFGRPEPSEVFEARLSPASGSALLQR